MHGESRPILWHTSSMKGEQIFLKFPWFILLGISTDLPPLSDDHFLVQANGQAWSE